jgi:hypothetical protein
VAAASCAFQLKAQACEGFQLLAESADDAFAGVPLNDAGVECQSKRFSSDNIICDSFHGSPQTVADGIFRCRLTRVWLNVS